MFFCGCTSNAPRFAQGQPNGCFQMKEFDGRASGRKGERKTYCMCTAIHRLYATDLPNKHSCAQARAGRAPGALSIKKTSVLLDDRQKNKLLQQLKEKVVEQLKLWSQ